MDTRRKFTFCRLCLCKSEVLMDIFQEDERLYTAAEVIIDLLQLHVSEDDGYSKFVCLRCFNKLSEFKQFKEQCIESKDTFEKEFVPTLRFTPPPSGANTVRDGSVVKTEILEDAGEESEVNSQMDIGDHGDIEREDIVVEVDVYPQMPPSPVNHDTDTRVNAVRDNSALQARDLSLPRGDAESLPNPYLNLKMTKKGREKQRKSFSSHTSVGGENNVQKRSRKPTPVRLGANMASGDAETAVECWQEMLSRTGVDVVSCDRQALGRNLGDTSLEYWRKKMNKETLDFGIGSADTEHLTSAAKADAIKVEKLCSQTAAVGAANLTSEKANKDRGNKVAEDPFTSDDESSSQTPPPGGKVHRCDLCNKVFTRSSSLFRHKRIHTGEKPFICAECGKTFTQSGYLMQHMRVHSGDRRFACEECGKMFTDSGNLIQHRRVHTGEKPYGCNVCGMSFTQNGHLARHLKVHSGERPFQCEDCGKKFTNCSNLSRHVKLHAEGRI